MSELILNVKDEKKRPSLEFFVEKQKDGTIEVKCDCKYSSGNTICGITIGYFSISGGGKVYFEPCTLVDDTIFDINEHGYIV